MPSLSLCLWDTHTIWISGHKMLSWISNSPNREWHACSQGNLYFLLIFITQPLGRFQCSAWSPMQIRDLIKFYKAGQTQTHQGRVWLHLTSRMIFTAIRFWLIKSHGLKQVFLRSKSFSIKWIILTRMSYRWYLTGER